MKYYVSVEYIDYWKNKSITEFIVTSYKDFKKADYRIKQYFTAMYSTIEQITDIRVISLDYFEKITIK